MTIEQAQSQIDAHERRKAELIAALAETGATLAELEARAGDAFLDGNEGVMRDVMDRRVRFDTISAALKALEHRRGIAEMDLQRATAADRRRQIVQKQAQLEKLNLDTGKLLRRLSELEGVTYTHSVLSSQPLPGVWLDAGSFSAQFPEWKGIVELTPEISNFGAKIDVPLSRKLLTQIEELELGAEAIERKLPPAIEHAA